MIWGPADALPAFRVLFCVDFSQGWAHILALPLLVAIMKVSSWHWLHLFIRLVRTKNLSGRFVKNWTTSSEVSRWNYDAAIVGLTHTQTSSGYNQFNALGKRLKCLRMKNMLTSSMSEFSCAPRYSRLLENHIRVGTCTAESLPAEIFSFFSKSFSIFILLFPFNLRELKGHNGKHPAFSNMSQNSRVLASRTAYSQLTL